MRTPRTLLIYSTLPEIGGNSTITLTVAAEYRKMGWDVLVLTRYQREHGLSQRNMNLLREMGCEVHTLTTTEGSYGLSTLRALLWVFQRGRGAVFVTLCIGYMSPILAFLGRFHKSIFYLITHERDRRAFKALYGYKHFIREYAVISPLTADPLKRFLSRQSTIPWLPQFSTFSSGEKTLEPAPADRTLTFGFLGSLNEGKGVRLLLKTWPKLSQPVELRIAGDGPLRPAVAEAAEASRAQPARITYLGAFNAAERDSFLHSFFKSIDYLIVPSTNHQEGIPTVILEALSYGVPVLASNLGGTACFGLDWLRPSRPEVVRLFDPEALPAALEEAISKGRPTQEDAKACDEYYRLWFSTRTVLQRWKDMTAG